MAWRNRFAEGKEIIMQAFNPNKFDSLVHYVCAKGDTDKLGAIKLNKILWFSDIIRYFVKGESITGAMYIKREFGPVPRPMPGALERLKEQGRLSITDTVHYGLPKREFRPLLDPNLTDFAPDEISLVDDVMDIIINQHTAHSISELTHDKIWKLAEIGEEIPYYTVLSSSFGEIDEDDIAWAKEVITREAA